MSAPTPATTASGHPFEGLYGFVRGHLLIVNNVVLASCTMVGALDFLAPRLSLLPRLLYSLTALLAVAMIAAALAPAFAARLWALAGREWASHPEPLWRRPGWQFGVAILAGVSIVGFASVAKAAQGGLIASAFPAARTLQENLLSMRADVSDIKTGVGQANEKLDRIASAVDPANPADRCADLDCAVGDGASVEAVARLFSKGVQLPGDPLRQRELLAAAAESPGTGRIEVIDLLARKGIDLGMLMPPSMFLPDSLTKQSHRVVADIARTANLAAYPMAFQLHSGAAGGGASKDSLLWAAVGDCFQRTSKGISLVEFAAMQGDAELTADLHARGIKAPERPLACRWRWNHVGDGFARVEIDPATGEYAGVSAR